MLSSSILYNKFRFGNTDLLGEDFLLFFLSKWTLKEKKKSDLNFNKHLSLEKINIHINCNLIFQF